MPKKLIVTFSDGSKYGIPLDAIASNRSKYYAIRDNPGKPAYDKDFSKTEDEEYRLTMTDEDTVIDWAKNNMDWKQVEYRAKPIGHTPINHSEEWCNCEMEVK